MAAASGIIGILWAVSSLLLEVVLFWVKKFGSWWKSRSILDDWLDALRNAESYEDWEHAALHLDNIKHLNLWRNDVASSSYDWTLIHRRLESLNIAREDRDLQTLIDLVRAGLVRNLGNITSPKLYNRSFAGTKYLVEEYIAQVVVAIEDINAQTASNVAPVVETSGGPQPSISTQRKLNFLHDSRQAFGRTTLVLQGGAIFGLCHLGVVKALFFRGLLPRIITGTATGALIASLVAIHTEDELPRILTGEGIDLSAFEAHAHHGQQTGKQTVEYGWETLLRRFRRFWKEGYFLDVKVLEDCVKANVGNLTFEEAFNRSKRILNITVATEGRGGLPSLLNYITAPNVLIWTAAVASNASTPSLYGSRGTTVLCKDANGNIVPWAPAHTFRHYTSASATTSKDSKSPLARIAQLFNVNHFIVSQARPYLIPFLESDMHGPSLFAARHRRAQITGNVIRMVGLETRHRLRQLDTLGLLPAGIRRFLVDEEIPGAHMTFVPKVTASDFVRLLETPTRETLDYWILRGERSVWPAICALRIRCVIEFEIERTYQQVRSLKAGGLRRKASINAGTELCEDNQLPLPDDTMHPPYDRQRAASIAPSLVPGAG
ncbi:hypothetical protein E8E14_002474 [Neopestalotiopsis sp. 37M]|nr:hypothetical protein E8E14_002474 [Neopestalotiopsis sp. 37M]